MHDGFWWIPFDKVKVEINIKSNLFPWSSSFSHFKTQGWALSSLGRFDVEQLQKVDMLIYLKGKGLKEKSLVTKTSTVTVKIKIKNIF